MLYSNEDFENFYVRYKAEGLSRNITVKAFCIHNKVPWNLFDKWYRDTRHRIAPVTISGRFSDMTEMEKRAVSAEKRAEEESTARSRAEEKVEELMKTIGTLKDIHRGVTRPAPNSTPSGNR